MSTVLGIWAHPDDEVFVSGGFMADAVRRGHRVACIHMTCGEAGLEYRQPCPPEMLARRRRGELENSLGRLGVAEQCFFGFPDGGLIEVHAEDAIERIHHALVDVNPDVILTFGPDGYTGHPDHKVLSAWVSAASRLWNRPDAGLYHAATSRAWKASFAPALNEFDFFWPGHPIGRAQPDFTLELDDDILDAKMASLRAHASQMEALFDAYGDQFMRQLAATEHFDLAPEPRLSLRAPSRKRNDLAA